jgi:predicted permease
MHNLTLLLICLVIGLLLQQVRSLPKDAHLTINGLILYVSLPAVALLNVPHLKFSVDLILLCLAPWLLFFVTFVLFKTIGERLGWSNSLIGCLTLVTGLGNTSFVGFPLIEALLGPEGVRLAVFFDQPGSFLIVSSIGIWVAGIYSSGRPKKCELARKVISFPPFIAFVMSVVMGVMGWHAERGAEAIMERLASLLTPLALISVGLQLKLNELQHDLKYLAIGLLHKLILSPLLIYALYSLLGLPSLVFEVAVLESAMAPMITATIVASTHGLHPRLASSLLGVGVPLSFFTVYFWHYLL